MVHNILDMRKLSLQRVMKCLDADQKCIRVMTSEGILECLAAGKADVMACLVTMDEAWLNCHDPKTKQQSVEWQQSGSPRPKTHKSAGKILAVVFWDTRIM